MEKRKIENYLCTPATLENYVRASVEKEYPKPLFHSQAVDSRMNAMHEAIEEAAQAMEAIGHGSPWDANTKASDDFLTPLFRAYFKKINLPNLMAKKSFYELAGHVPEDQIDPEIREKSNVIIKAAKPG